jgi:type VI secretion system ImpM family protein
MRDKNETSILMIFSDPPTSQAMLHGKLPARGDFIAVCMTATLGATWQPWIDENLSWLKQDLGNDWAHSLMEWPMQEFCLLPDEPNQPSCLIGVICPSVDSVGRFYPLTVFALWPVASAPTAWYSQARAFLNHALEPQNPYETTVQALEALATSAEISSLAWIETEAFRSLWRVPSAQRFLSTEGLPAPRPLTRRMKTALKSNSFDVGSITDKGLKRAHNEDSFLCRTDLGLWAIADGLGGYDAGDIASRLAVEALSTLKPAASLQDLTEHTVNHLQQAHDAIHTYADQNGIESCGTTVVVFLAQMGAFTALWSGDSRLYRWRNGSLEPITKDHSAAQEKIDAGELTPQTARSWPRRNQITQALGVFDDFYVETRTGNYQPNDVFLLCSDGLTEHVEDAEIATALANSPSAQTASDALLQLTLARGASDNITVIVVRCVHGP